MSDIQPRGVQTFRQRLTDAADACDAQLAVLLPPPAPAALSAPSASRKRAVPEPPQGDGMTGWAAPRAAMYLRLKFAVLDEAARSSLTHMQLARAQAEALEVCCAHLSPSLSGAR